MYDYVYKYEFTYMQRSNQLINCVSASATEYQQNKAKLLSLPLLSKERRNGSLIVVYPNSTVVSMFLCIPSFPTNQM